MQELAKYEKEFERVIRMRGNDYFHSNKVQILSLLPGKEAKFKVFGTYPYFVSLIFDDRNDLQSFCSCPYFERENSCKHTWAAMLAAEKNSFFKEKKSQNEGQLSQIDLHPSLSPSLKTIVLFKDQIHRFKSAANSLASAELFMTPTSHSPYVYQRMGAFVIDPFLSLEMNKWALKFYASESLSEGGWGKFSHFPVAQEDIHFYEEDLDRKALRSFLGVRAQNYRGNDDSAYVESSLSDCVYLQSNMADSLLSELSEAKKLQILTANNELVPLCFDKNSLALELYLEELAEDKGSNFFLRGNLVNKTKKIPINSVQFYSIAPYVLTGQDLVCADFSQDEEWFSLLKETPELFIPYDDIDSFLSFYFNYHGAPALHYPETLRVKYKNKFSKVRLVIDVENEISSEVEVENATKNAGVVNRKLTSRLQFLYGENYVDYADDRSQFFSTESRTVFKRNIKDELIESSKFYENKEGDESLTIELDLENDLSNDPFKFKEFDLERVVGKAFYLGWEIIAFKKNVNMSKDYNITISSGIDWFDLSVEFQFSNGFIFGLPQLLQTIKSGQKFVSLADGTTGVIPNEWIKKFNTIMQAGSIEGDNLRLTKIQTLFYAREFCEDKNFKSDKKFKTLLRIVEDINNISEISLDPRFKGKLRKYQKIGVSWINLMSNHGIGAVLADDMGLGKTVQILAAISKTKKTHSLIVAPKSLVFNWISEAAKFTPHLKFHDHTGSFRMDCLEELEKSQVIITTYQTFRQDIEFFQGRQFEYFILDEAHYIKNSDSQGYMACKLITAHKKIALTGTPVENSLKDLFSILSIVNPGLISNSLADKYANEMDPEAIGILAKSLRPFILRRTKDKVLKDLPKKTEQVLYCDLSDSERKKYDELKNYYWNNLSNKIGEKGFQRAKIEILEAILRLRQASCHPGLLNKNFASKSSAKFELMLEQLDSVINDGHKALVFSQFTTLLKLFGKALAKKKMKYEYLDGKTNNRALKVKNFQENDSIQLFLISLKAGGVGLNLTSADYVFILDPWWNPAAESQAIDRAHRYGQTKQVFAYKIIAKDTIEEKILALQERKRALAHAMISSEKSLIKGMKMEDLRELFS